MVLHGACVAFVRRLCGVCAQQSLALRSIVLPPNDVIARNVRLVLESAAHAGVSTQEAALRVARGRLLEIQQRAA